MMAARRQRLRSRFAALLGAAMFLVAAGALADDADVHFRHGVELYKDNDFSAALVEFQRAYALDPKYQVLYNVAESHFQLQDYANALKAFQKYLYEGGTKISARRRKEVDREVEKLRRRVAVVTIETKEPGAKITIDDVPAGTTPLGEPLLVSAGRRRVGATIAGRPPVTQVIELAGGDSPTITLDIPANEVKVVTLQRPSLAPPVIAWGATAAVLTGAVVTGVLALGASSDLKTKLAAFPGDSSAIASAHDKTAALSLATDILGAFVLVGAGVATYLTIKVTRTAPRAADPAPGPSARVVLSPTSAGLAGSF